MDGLSCEEVGEALNLNPTELENSVSELLNPSEAAKSKIDELVGISTTRNRVVVNNQSSLTLSEAMGFVQKVIDQGLISGSSSKVQYCYLTVFTLSNNTELYVSATLNKQSHSFNLRERPRRD